MARIVDGSIAIGTAGVLWAVDRPLLIIPLLIVGAAVVCIRMADQWTNRSRGA